MKLRNRLLTDILGLLEGENVELSIRLDGSKPRVVFAIYGKADLTHRTFCEYHVALHFTSGGRLDIVNCAVIERASPKRTFFMQSDDEPNVKRPVGKDTAAYYDFVKKMALFLRYGEKSLEFKADITHTALAGAAVANLIRHKPTVRFLESIGVYKFKDLIVFHLSKLYCYGAFTDEMASAITTVLAVHGVKLPDA